MKNYLKVKSETAFAVALHATLQFQHYICCDDISQFIYHCTMVQLYLCPFHFSQTYVEQVGIFNSSYWISESCSD